MKQEEKRNMELEREEKYLTMSDSIDTLAREEQARRHGDKLDKNYDTLMYNKMLAKEKRNSRRAEKDHEAELAVRTGIA